MSAVAPPVPPALALRERRYRRTLLLGLGLLLFLGLGPLFAHHLRPVPVGIGVGAAHLGRLCLIALHALIEPLHRLFHLLLGAGLLFGAWDRYRAWRAAHATLACLESVSPVPEDPFWRAARAVGVDPRIVRIVHGLPAPAFTIGWLRPRIYVAQALADRLQSGQLNAVLAHEGVHARRRDPLRVSLLRFLACTFFWIPALRRLCADLVDEIEILADDGAAHGRPLVLASALLALTRGSDDGFVPQAAVGFQRRGLLERRVRRLLGEATPLRSRLTRRSLAGAIATLGLIFVSSLGVLRPHPLQDASQLAGHCDHHVRPGIAHLFCLVHAGCAAMDRCPHRRG